MTIDIFPTVAARIGDPGAYVQRKTTPSGEPMESVPRWAARAVVEAVQPELDRLRAQVADLADKLHKANADNASLTKAGTAWANEVAAKDKVVEAAKAWVRADVADFGRTGAALIDAVEDLPQKAEVA